MLHNCTRKLAALASGLILLSALAACAGAATPASQTASPASQTTAPASQSNGPKDLLDTIKGKGVMRVSTDANYAPQSFFDEKTKQWKGFDIDTANELGKRLGVKVEFVTPQWDAITAGNWAGRWDVSVGSMIILPEFEKVLDFTPPYYYTLAQFAVRSDLAATIKTIDDLSGKTVCAAKSTTYADYLNGRLNIKTITTQAPKNVKVLSGKSGKACLWSLESGRKEYDAVLTAADVVDAEIQKGAPIVLLGKPVFSEQMVIAVDKSSAPNAKFVAALSKAVNDMHADGTLSKLAMKYFGYDLSQLPK